MRLPPSRPPHSRVAAPGNAASPASGVAPRPCIVLLPGTLCDARLFGPCLARLRRALPQWDFRAIDFHGLEAGPDAWARKVWSVLPPHVGLLGFSLGGIAALHLLRADPSRVHSLALVASNAEPGSRRARLRARRQHALWGRGGADGVMRWLLPAYFPQMRERLRLGRHVNEMARDTRGAVARTQFDWAAQRKSGHDVLKAFDGPILVLSGQRDRFCPRRMQRRLVQSRPDARWIELPLAGHFLPLERPAAVARHVARWLAQPLLFPWSLGDS